jgi:hypothetical protein
MGKYYLNEHGKPVFEDYKTIRLHKDPFILQPFVNKKKYYTYEDLLLLEKAIENTKRYYEVNNINPYHENHLQLKQKERDKIQAKKIAEEEHRIWQSKRKSVKLAYIYLLHDPANNVYKIGKAKNVKSRFGSIKTGNINVELITNTSIAVNQKHEDELHRMFKDKRIGGEWFDLDETDIKNVKYYLEEIVEPDFPQL